MPWGAIAGALAGGILAGQASKDAAKTAQAGQREAIAEQRRQFDIAQKQQKPWRQAGESALGRYEQMLGQRGTAESQIRSNIPGAYHAPTNIPGAFSSRAGDYGGQIQNNVQPGFQFGRQEFEQYKDPGYDFRKEEGLRALERANAAGGQRTGGYNTRSLMELGQNLASQEYGAARSRALKDYETRVNREQQQYGRSVAGYGRDIARESELYGRGRQTRVDEAAREQELYRRGLGDYTRDVAREQQQYGRDINRYGRTYLDPMEREMRLSEAGRSTASGMAGQTMQQGRDVGGRLGQIGSYGAAGQLGAAGAYAGALGSIGQAYDNYPTNEGMVYGNPIEGDAYMPAYPGQGGY